MSPPNERVPMPSSDKEILFFFNHSAVEDVAQIDSGETPSERLYGFIELRDRGWKVATCEERFRGALTTLFQKLRHYGFNLMNLRALRRAAKSDVLLVKDDFSFPLTLTAALFRKRLIYLDSMFFMPGNRLKRFLLGINMRCAPLIVSYSQFQVDLWSAAFSIPKNRFVVLPYTIDYPFYARGANQSGAAAAQEPPYI